MKRTPMTGAAALASTFAAASGHAVDITSHDQEADQPTTIMDGGMSRVFEIPAGQTMTNVCEECSLVLGGQEPVEAAGPQRAEIRDGKVKIQ